MHTYFALRHADELEDYNIAKSAIDGKQAIEGSTATSIAVNNGSVDFISDGTTSTTDVNDDIITFSSVEDKYTYTIDIGYHYLSGTDNGLEHPSMTVTGATAKIIYPNPQRPPEFVAMNPCVMNPHGLAVVSGKNPFPGKPDNLTMLFYESNWINRDFNEDGDAEWGFFLMYEWYEAELSGSIDLFYMDPYWEQYIEPLCLKIAGTSNIKGDTNEGKVYVAASAIFEEYPWSIASVCGSQLRIYRYNPNYDNWTLLMTKSEMFDEDSNIIFTDVALSAKNDDLWVFWVEADYEAETYKIKGKRIANAATTGDTLVDPSGSEIGVDLEFAIIGGSHYCNDEVQLGADWDSEIEKPRISWIDTYSENNSVDRVVRSARILLDLVSGEPFSIQYLTHITKDPITQEIDWQLYSIPCLSVNKYDRSKYSSTDDEVFLSWNRDDQSNPPVIKNNMITVTVTPSTDTYNYPIKDFTSNAISDLNEADYPDTTYRAFGSERRCFIKNNEVVTNTEKLGPASMYSRITTSSRTLTNIFTAYCTYSDSITIREIDP